MERTQELFEKIELYLNNGLSSDEQAAFERNINADPDLKREVALHRSLLSELNDTDSIEFRQRIVEIARNLKEKKKRKKKSLFWKITAAAAAAIIVGVSMFIWQQNSDYKNHLFEDFYEVYPVEDMVRGNVKNNLDSTLDKYENGNFMEAIPELSEFVKQNPKDASLKLYLGNCLLQTSQEKKAIDVFKDIPFQSSNYEDAQWYLALSYIKIGDKQKAESVLKGLVEFDGVHRKNAQSLINELNY